MQDVTIIDTDDGIRLVSPYHPDCPKLARRIGGKWDPATRSWRFDIRDRERVEQLAADLWGYSTGNTSSAVTIRVNADAYTDGNEIRVAGRSIAHRAGRDEPVRLAGNAIIVHGEFAPSGGSMKYPDIGECDQVVIEIRDLPASALDMLEPGRYELVDDDPITVLKAERQRLMDRISEIDRRIGEMTS
ncbi:hypothetical protein [Bifidobacterium vansinderenii]|uniref:Uncharacterized protein n=1 Tax=Bifidobacterium vansinderenii TaxID=1984871 RepID=A0A229W0X9_9BIFI|nr:hypothetical protein [Bifidobacterium vansinderenii]OXN01502.1 hypothetical protein Tam10B_0505 [Bifidobacterium vansinderenii]